MSETGTPPPRPQAKAPAAAPPARPQAAAPLSKTGVYLSGVAGTPLDQLCFLTFYKPTNIVAASLGFPSPCYAAYVGAIPDLAEPDEKKRTWARLGHDWIKQNEDHFTHQILWEFPEGGPISIAYLDAFYEGAFRALQGFTHEKRLDFCKGETKATCPAIVMKALTKGFESIGIPSEKPSLVKRVFAAKTILGDIAAFMSDVLKGAPARLDGLALEGFDAVNVAETAGPWSKDISYKGCKDLKFVWPGQKLGYSNPFQEYFSTWRLPIEGKGATEKNPYAGPISAIADQQKSPLGKKGIVIVHEYGFRGDTRLPVLIKAAGGMFANATRDDGAAKGMVDARHGGAAGTTPVLDSLAHQHDGIQNTGSSGFVSVSNSRLASQDFIKRPATPGSSGLGGTGVLYIVRARGAVDVNASWSAPPSPQECELSVPGALGWEDVVGWRLIKDKSFTGPLYLTKNTNVLPADKRKKILEIMSYKDGAAGKG